MRRLIALTLVALCLSAGAAFARGVGIGAFAGMSVPVLQEDVDKGNMFGVRVPVNLVPLFTVEPYYASAALGEATESVGGIDYTREGFDEKAYGVNAMLTLGGPVSFYPYAGVGQTSLKRTGFDDCSIHAKTWDLLRMTRMVTVRLEAGYLSNTHDLERLTQPHTRQEFAEAIASAIHDFFSPG